MNDDLKCFFGLYDKKREKKWQEFLKKCEDNKTEANKRFREMEK